MFYHTRSSGADHDALKAGFRKCGQIVKQTGSKEVGLAVPGKSNLDGVISDLIGEEAVKVLQRDNMLDLKTFTIYLITKRVKPRNFQDRCWLSILQ